MPHRIRRSGDASDRHAPCDPLAFREGKGRWLDAGCEAQLQNLIDACREDLRLVTGDEPGADDARAMLDACPPDVDPDQRLAFGLYDAAGALAAAVDVYKDFPRERAWTLTLLLVRPDLRGRGVASGLLARVERLVAQHGGEALHAVLPARNPALRQLFLRAGYHQERELALALEGRRLRGLHLVRALGAAAVAG